MQYASEAQFEDVPGGQPVLGSNIYDSVFHGAFSGGRRRQLARTWNVIDGTRPMIR